MSNCVGSSGLGLPASAVARHGVERGDEIAPQFSGQASHLDRCESYKPSQVGHGRNGSDATRRSSHRAASLWLWVFGKGVGSQTSRAKRHRLNANASPMVLKRVAKRIKGGNHLR